MSCALRDTIQNIFSSPHAICPIARTRSRTKFNCFNDERATQLTTAPLCANKRDGRLRPTVIPKICRSGLSLEIYIYLYASTKFQPTILRRVKTIVGDFSSAMGINHRQNNRPFRTDVRTYARTCVRACKRTYAPR